MKTARRSRAFWEKAVAQVERGASCADVATRLGVKVATLRWWRSALRRPAPPSSPAPVRVLPVEVELSTHIASRLELRLGTGDVMTFDTGTSPAYVAAIVAALRAAC
jgi:transposase-like protein